MGTVGQQPSATPEPWLLPLWLLQLVRLSNLHLSDFPMSGEVGRDRAVTFGGTMRSTAGYTRSTSGNRFGFWMAFKVSLAMLRTPKGLFKILEFVLVLTCILIARFGPLIAGNDKESYLGSSIDWMILNCGTLVGFEIILIAILLTYLLGAEPTVLELVIEAIGFFLFLAIGTNYCRHVSDAGLGALGGLCVI